MDTLPFCLCLQTLFNYIERFVTYVRFVIWRIESVTENV